MKHLLLIASALVLTGCMEAQPPHQVTDLSSSDFQIETISDGLLKPWGIAELPNGSFLVTEFSGALKHIKNGEVRDISGLPDDIFVNGQGGLMGIVLAPDFASSRELFMSYAYGTKDANGTAIFRARLKGAALTGGETIFRAGTKAAGSHFGGRMAFLPDDSLILTLGDGFAYREEAQNLGSHLGKILRLSRDGTPLADNPFSDNSEAKAEIYSYGHRNVQGLIYDAKSGNLWSHEHGPRGGDELNLLKPGANYGWPLATTGRDYNGARITPHDTYEGTEPFIHDWVPSIAPSGLAIYRGDKFPQWEGDALVGALAGQSLWVIDLDGTKSVGETRLLSNLKKRVRDVIVDQDGTILILTESEDGGQLLRISPKP